LFRQHERACSGLGRSYKRASTSDEEDHVKTKLIIASILVTALASPALAASYYVVQSTKTQKCTVVTKKPAAKSKTTVLVGDGTVYKTKSEATTAIGTIAVCKTA
jgi:hypothetical protein